MLGYRLYRDLQRGLAGHLAEPGAVRPAGDPLPVARRALRGRGRVGRTATRPWRRLTRRSGAQIAKVLLDYMRRELAIKVDYLDTGVPGEPASSRAASS